LQKHNWHTWEVFLTVGSVVSIHSIASQRGTWRIAQPRRAARNNARPVSASVIVAVNCRGKRLTGSREHSSEQSLTYLTLPDTCGFRGSAATELAICENLFTAAAWVRERSRQYDPYLRLGHSDISQHKATRHDEYDTHDLQTHVDTHTSTCEIDVPRTHIYVGRQVRIQVCLMRALINERSSVLQFEAQFRVVVVMAKHCPHATHPPPAHSPHSSHSHTHTHMAQRNVNRNHERMRANLFQSVRICLRQRTTQRNSTT
jgi:hypothetical protein